MKPNLKLNHLKFKRLCPPTLMANNVGSFKRDRSLMMSHCHSHCDLRDTVLHYFFREKKEHTMTAELILSPSSMILLNKFPRNTRNLNLNPYDSGIKKKVWYLTSGGNKCNIDQPKVNEFIINEFVHELKEEDYDLWKNSREKWRKCISVTGSLRGQEQVRPIDKLDEACTNADDRMMLVQHRSGDRVMS